jgi:hypothetical protein
VGVPDLLQPNWRLIYGPSSQVHTGLRRPTRISKIENPAAAHMHCLSTYRLAFFKPQVAWDNSIIDALACVELNVSDSDLLFES